jgi:hypothetical protein
MQKLLLLTALFAMVVVATLPAIAAAKGNGKNNHHDNNNGGGNGGGTEISQDNEQDTQSGATSQGIIIEGPGDNANQCIGLQPITNTGNATNQTGILQYANKGSDVGVDDAGNLTISPSQTTTCDQKVNQAASASGG